MYTTEFSLIFKASPGNLTDLHGELKMAAVNLISDSMFIMTNSDQAFKLQCEKHWNDQQIQHRTTSTFTLALRGKWYNTTVQWTTTDNKKARHKNICTRYFTNEWGVILWTLLLKQLILGTGLIRKMSLHEHTPTYSCTLYAGATWG